MRFVVLFSFSVMDNQNFQIPLFGRAGNSNLYDWADTDNFDAELLAQYLLDDAPTVPSISFDKKINKGTTETGVVSPEISEDDRGIPRHPGNSVQATSAPGLPLGNPLELATQVSATQSPFAHLAALTQAVNGLPVFPGLQLSAALNLTMMAPQQPGAVDVNAAKRQRVDQHSFGALEQQQLRLPAVPITQVAHGLPFFAVAGNNSEALMTSPQLTAVAASLEGQGRGSRKKSQAQIDRRRERNRILARRTRMRKKFFLESLQKNLMDLQKENASLKELVRANLKDEEAKIILDECDALEKLPPSVLETLGEAALEIDSKDSFLVRSIQSSQQSFIITDPSLQDNPIVFASEGFLTLTGYKKGEVLGRNCRFLQGSETSTEKVEMLRQAVRKGEDVSVTLINYKADGTPFWNKLFIAALRESQNLIVNYIGVLVKVAGPLPDDTEYGKLLPGEDFLGDDEENRDDFDDDDIDLED